MTFLTMTQERWDELSKLAATEMRDALREATAQRERAEEAECENKRLRRIADFKEVLMETAFGRSITSYRAWIDLIQDALDRLPGKEDAKREALERQNRELRELVEDCASIFNLMQVAFDATDSRRASVREHAALLRSRLADIGGDRV